MDKQKLERYLAGGLIVLLVIVAFNAYTVLSLGSQVSKKIDEARELAKPAEIEITAITVECADCFSLEQVLKALKENANLKITKEETLASDSEDAKALIERYKIEKLPAIIIKGQLEKAALGKSFNTVDDAAVFASVLPPYVDAKTSEVKGRVTSIIISDSTCEKCSDMQSLIDSFKKNHVVFASEQTLDYKSEEAKTLIEKYSIKSVPTALLSTDVLAYPALAQSMAQLKLEEKDGFFVLTGLSTPYVEVETGKVVGLVKLVMLTDSACTDCYDVAVHKQVLSRFGLAIEEEKTLDISTAEGKALVAKYSIKNVPTVVITGDVDKYTSLTRVWEQVGTVETDGAYIFRTISALGNSLKYMDLETKTVVST